MPQYQNTLFTQLVTLVNSTWGDVAAGGVYRARELLRRSLDQKALALPCVAIDLDPLPWEGRPVNTRGDLNRVWIYRLTDDGETPETLIEKLEAMRTALYPDNPSTRPLASAQVMEWPRISDSPRLPLNDQLVTSAKPFYLGAVIADILIGA